MFKNPEFIRNAWTELKLKNLVSMPLLLITLYCLSYTLTADMIFSIQPKISIVFYVVFTFIWGTRRAAETVVKEINNNTWAFQVMTPISPTKMAIGKLFGSTALIWYGNLICMVLYVLSYTLDAARLPYISAQDLTLNVLLFILFGLIAHVTPLLVSIHSIRWRHFFERFDLTFFQLTGILAILPLFYAVFSESASDEIMWYGHLYIEKVLIFIFALIFFVWAFISVVNQLKTEFGQEPYPIAWFLFTVTLIVISFGFNVPNAPFVLTKYIGSISAFFITVCLTYLTLCGESNLALRPHMVLKYFKTKQYKRLFMIMPRSLVTIPIIVVLAFILQTQLAAEGDAASTSFSYIIWAMIMFMLRDFCFVYLWSIFSQGNDRETTVVPVLITLMTYTILPIFFYNTGMSFLCPLFMPFFYDGLYMSFTESALLTVIPPTVEFLAMLTLLICGIKRKKSQIELDTEFSV